MDINGQLCFFPDDPHRLIAGEDTGQPERTPGWGIFEIDGDRVGDLSARQVGRLVPSYQNDPDNYGCGVLSDGRVVTTDIGNKVEGPPSGQLIMWFPPFDSEQVSYCKLDVTLPTPGGIVVGRRRLALRRHRSAARQRDRCGSPARTPRPPTRPGAAVAPTRSEPRWPTP